MAKLLRIPSGLEDNAIDKFDALVAHGEILYAEAYWKRVEDGNVTVNFLISPALRKKPILSKHDSGRTKPKGPFVDPDPDFVLGSVGPSHTLIFNKFCFTRPMFLLHTNEFQQQTEDLNESDLAVAWSLLVSFVSPYMVIYNCGADAGASQGHKHLQLFPAPNPENCVLFPQKLELSDDSIHSDESVPFQNFVIRLDKTTTISQLVSKYQILLSATKNALAQSGYEGTAYNVVLLPNWMALIPRTHANNKGKAPTNAVGMVGMICVDDDEEVDEWLNFGIAKHLTYLGLANSSAK